MKRGNLGLSIFIQEESSRLPEQRDALTALEECGVAITLSIWWRGLVPWGDPNDFF